MCNLLFQNFGFLVKNHVAKLPNEKFRQRHFQHVLLIEFVFSLSHINRAFYSVEFELNLRSNHQTTKLIRQQSISQVIKNPAIV